MTTSENVPASRILRTVEEAARQLRISERTLRKLIAEGAIEIVRIRGKLFITQAAVDAYIDSSREWRAGGDAA